MNKKKLFLIIGSLWIVIVGGLIASKEFVLRTGDEVLLKMAPVDPRDLFRGDYVILRYEISTINIYKYGFSYSKDGSSSFLAGDTVYVLLNIDKYGYGSLAGLSRVAPRSGEGFIKGTVERESDGILTVQYGIESYFVPEGKGREIERNREKFYAKVAIDQFGNAVIKSLASDGLNSIEH